MSAGVLLDAGPLVAYFSAREGLHDWAVDTLAALEGPIVTCEPVLTEACFLLARNGLAATRILEPLQQRRFAIGLHMEDELPALYSLMRRYASVPMSLADACLVRMAELTDLPICTLDADFTIYRAHGRRRLSLISPTSGYGFHEAEDEGDSR